MKSSDQHKTYLSLEDLPAWNFFKAKDKEELKYLLILDSYQDLDKIEFSELKLKNVWDQLYDEYVDAFSFDSDYKKILKIRADIVIAEAEFAMSQDNFHKNTIRRLYIDLDNLMESDDSGKKPTFEEQIIMLEDWRKIPIDSKKITCMRFFTLRNKAKKESRKSQISKLVRDAG